MTPEISIVIPAFNEALRLPATLDRVERHLAAINVPVEVIVVDDGSRDATAAIVAEIARERPRICRSRTRTGSATIARAISASTAASRRRSTCGSAAGCWWRA